jgi:prepilin-type N-terminal cleavage/methylation domain-containing protein
MRRRSPFAFSPLPFPFGRGFTLIEVVVTLALLVLTLFLVGVPIFSSFRYFRSGSARADAQTAARLALDSMARELTEAMYVQLDMYDNSSLAFFLPLRVNPDDPNSELVTPPRPDWSQAIRYCRALYDPTVNYNPGTRPAVRDNTFFVARSVVPEPLTYTDDWNRWNDVWAAGVAGEDGVAEWAPISRLVNSDLGRAAERDASARLPVPRRAEEAGHQGGHRA